MAEQSFLWTTGSAGDGISTYTRADWQIIAKILAACGSWEGVAPDYLENLYPYTAGLNTVQIGTGGALVDGKPYSNSSRVNVNIPSAIGTGNRRYDRVVLRCDWSSQTIRITRVGGTDAASPALPALTQNSGSVYDLELCYVLVDTSGNITVTDDRTMSKIGQTGIKDAAITSRHIAAGAVDASKLGSQIPPLKYRVGGSPNNWFTPGATVYTVGSVIWQAGVASLVVYNGSTGNEVNINFPQAFLDSPIILVTPHAVVGPTSDVPTAIVYRWSPDGGYATGFTAHVTRTPGSTGDQTVWLSWLAIGPVA